MRCARFVQKKANQRWLWHGINHYTGEILAYVLGSRTDEMFLQLKKLLEPFGITKFYTDGLKTYSFESSFVGFSAQLSS